MDKEQGQGFIRNGAEGVGRNSQVKGMDSDDTLENNIFNCTEEVNWQLYGIKPISNLSGKRTEADKRSLVNEAKVFCLFFIGENRRIEGGQ